MKFDRDKSENLSIQVDIWNQEKQARFELRTIQQLFAYQGNSCRALDIPEEELTWAVVNSQKLFIPAIFSVRMMKFNYEQLLLGKEKDPVLNTWLDCKDGDRGRPCSVIFRCAKFGGKEAPLSLVVTDFPNDPPTNHLKLFWGEWKLVVLSFKVWSQLLKEDGDETRDNVSGL